MRVDVNGERRDVPDGCTLAQLLQQRNADPRRVAIEVNRELVTRSHYDQTVLSDGDTVEIVTLVGGG